MKTYTRPFLMLLFLFAFLVTTFAQTYDDFKKKEKEKLSQFQENQENEIEKLAEKFDKYMELADKKFMEFLKKEWKQYQSFKSSDIPESTKPVQIPECKPDAIINKLSPKEILIIISNDETSAVHDRPLMPLIQKTAATNYSSSKFNVDYYGTNLTINIDDKLFKQELKGINEQDIGNWWSECSNYNYNLTVNQLLRIKNELSLNDWAYYKLVNKTSDAVANSDFNKAQLLNWFLMIRSGYDVKVAFNDNNVYLLYPTTNELYGSNYLIINSTRYYFTGDISSNTFQTYDFDFPTAERVIDFNIYQPLNIGDDVTVKQIKFKHLNKDYSFPVEISINTINLLKDYPVTELCVCFNGAMSRVTKQSLAEGIMPIIQNMDTKEALNLLLSFVQKSFIYKTDQDQFNKEKFFFPEEVFYYNGSDCEDRSALFTYLVKQLLHMEVIGLEYNGHVATAVNTNNEALGDFFVYNDAKYTIADPTYINAPLGITMPKYKNQEAKVIETSNVNYLTSVSNDYWRLTNELGGFRSNNLIDLKYDNDGNCYLTGYYSKDVSFGDEDWISEEGSRQPFVVKYNKQKEILWAKNILTDGIATGFALTIDKTGNPIIAGSFKGEINADGHNLTTINGKEDIFIASYDKDGDLRWLEKSGLDTLDYSQFLNYVVKFDYNGQHIDTKLYLENASKTSNGIFNIDNTIAIVGGINFTISYSTSDLSFNAKSDFNTITYLKNENDALIKNNVDKSIAGLFAVINLIKSSGMVIPGKEAQKALNKYNPDFKTLSPSIYENIGKITFMKNDNGIISIKTNNNESVSFDRIKIINGANIKITSLQNSNEQIEILSGVEVGKAFIWYNLNFVRMIHDRGDLLFDYDSDHTQKTVNMKDDILD